MGNSDLQIICRKNYNTKVRRDSKVFKEHLADIYKITGWLSRDNFTERVYCIAHNITEEPICKVSNKRLSEFTKTPIHRLPLLDVMHCCFSLKQRWNQVITLKDVQFEYDYNYCLQKIYTSSSLRSVLQVPILVYCSWDWLYRNKITLHEQVKTNEEACYLCYNNIIKIPACPITNKKSSFNVKAFKYNVYENINVSKTSYLKIDKLKKRDKSQQTIEKTKQTNIKKYGVTNPCNIQQHRLKAIQTRRQNCYNKRVKKQQEYKTWCLETFNKQPNEVTKKDKWQYTMLNKYNTTNTLSQDFSNILGRSHSEFRKNCLEKSKQTCLEKYGVDNPNKNADVIEKRNKTIISKYGSHKNAVSQKVKDQTRERKLAQTYYNFDRFKHISTPLFSLDEWLQDPKQLFPWKYTETGEQFMCHYYGYPPTGTLIHTDIERIIKNILKTNKIEFETKNRTILSGKEIDFYIPSRKLGIECNGDYWHSTAAGAHKKYHLNKHNAACNNKVSLLQFTGTEILYNRKIVKNIILNRALGPTIKIGARQCTFKHITSKQARIFCNKYHIQGHKNGNVYYGCFYKNRLISVATFIKERFSKSNNNTWELLRYINMGRIQVHGGLSKFLHIFKKEHQPTCIITFADKRLFTGSAYEATGFVKTLDTPISYIYSNGRDVLSRFQCQKHKLQKKFANIDLNLTEEQNMANNNYYRIYDCGCYKYRYNM